MSPTKVTFWKLGEPSRGAPSVIRTVPLKNVAPDSANHPPVPESSVAPEAGGSSQPPNWQMPPGSQTSLPGTKLASVQRNELLATVNEPGLTKRGSK